MIPAEYANFFTTMAAVGATLFGLIFVAISIAPESFASEHAPLERQAKATTAYIALLNPLLIALFALVPHQQIGVVVLGASGLGLVNTLGMTLALFLNSKQRGARLRRSLFIAASFTLYGYEAYFGVRLWQVQGDPFALFALSDLMIVIYAFGIIRAWELIGIRQFRLRGWLQTLRGKKEAANGHNGRKTSIEEERK